MAAKRYTEPATFTDADGDTWHIGQKVRFCGRRHEADCVIESWTADPASEFAKLNLKAILTRIDGGQWTYIPNASSVGASFKSLLPIEAVQPRPTGDGA